MSSLEEKNISVVDFSPHILDTCENSEDPNKGPHKAAFLSGSAPLAKTKYHLEVHARELLYN